MQKLIFLAAFVFSSLIDAEEIRVWVPEDEIAAINAVDYKTLEKAGISPHPCGYVKSITVPIVPPPDSEQYIEGTEKVYEFDQVGTIINQWAIPVDSYLYAVSGEDIIVRYGSGALSISRGGALSPSSQSAVQPELAECPQPIKKMYGNSTYVRCTKHTDINNNKPRYFVYEGVCT